VEGRHGGSFFEGCRIVEGMERVLRKAIEIKRLYVTHACYDGNAIVSLQALFTTTSTSERMMSWIGRRSAVAASSLEKWLVNTRGWAGAMLTREHVELDATLSDELCAFSRFRSIAIVRSEVYVLCMM
jgi:hypothetical protein